MTFRLGKAIITQFFLRSLLCTSLSENVMVFLLYLSSFLREGNPCVTVFLSRHQRKSELSACKHIFLVIRWMTVNLAPFPSFTKENSLTLPPPNDRLPSCFFGSKFYKRSALKWQFKNSLSAQVLIFHLTAVRLSFFKETLFSSF